MLLGSVLLGDDHCGGATTTHENSGILLTA